MRIFRPITLMCEECQERFTVGDPGPLGAIASGHPGPRFCGRLCRSIWRKRERAKIKGPCDACDDPYGPQTSAYGLGLCHACRYVVNRSCWSKIRFDTREDVPGELTGETMFPYDCPCCPGWHMSRHQEVDDGAYRHRLKQIGVLIQRVGFDVNACRDWKPEFRG